MGVRNEKAARKGEMGRVVEFKLAKYGMPDKFWIDIDMLSPIWLDPIYKLAGCNMDCSEGRTKS